MTVLSDKWGVKMKEGWSVGKIIGVIAGVIAAVIILWVAFVASVFQLIDFVDEMEEDSADEYEWSFDYDDKNDFDDKDWGDWYDDEDEDQSSGGGNIGEGEYYEFENDIREDLFYQVEIQSYEKGDFTSEKGGKANVSFEYARVSGDVPNLDGINQALYEEVSKVEKHIDSSLEYLSENDNYEYTGTCYVTYMSEDIFSVAYVEYGYLNDQFLQSYVISLNFDMQTGMVLGNTNLINVNDQFSVDFRDRCEKQNGEISGLSILSDQEITEYLSDKDSLIIFYTPLGMEIGFNYYDGWATVTYRDYEKFTKQF